MKAIFNQLMRAYHPASALESFDDDFENKWRKKVDTIRKSDELFAAASRQLSREFCDYLDSLKMSGHCPVDLHELIDVIDSIFSSSTTAFLHDCITEEKYSLIQRISPALIAELRAIDNGTKNLI